MTKKPNRTRAQIAAAMTAASRARLEVLAARERAKRIALEVSRGVEESVSLGALRGAEFDSPEAKPGEHAKPRRRLTGLEWLSRKGKIDGRQRAAGERYGEIYRIIAVEDELHALDVQGVAAGTGTALMKVLRDADERADARKELFAARKKLRHQQQLIKALDLICGQEMTPREAAADGRDSIKVECLLIVALDLLCTPATTEAA